jgi:hypothetical protein
MPAGLRAGDIVRRGRTAWHRGDSIGVYREAASVGCKNLHQQSQQQNREDGLESLPQNFGLFRRLNRVTNGPPVIKSIAR